MNESNFESFAYVAADCVAKPKAVIISFPGLGSCEMKSSLDMKETDWASKGALMVFPFVNPWNWMNPKTVKFADEVLACVEGKYKTKGLPLIVRGGSMGGHSALTYAMLSTRKLAGCLAICPVCDLHFHYSERPDLPRTLHDSFDSYEDISEGLKERSPVHRADKLPDIDYMIVHGEKDKSVAKAPHSDALVKRMRERGLRINYVEDARMFHCNPYSIGSIQAIDAFIEGFLK